MTLHSRTRETEPGFRTALSNRKVQMLIGFLAAAAAASGTALAVRSTDQAAGNGFSRTQIEQIVHDYILEHPEILPEAMERLQARRVSQVIETQRRQIETPYGGAWEGAKDGDVTIVEFFDYGCGYCRASLPDIARLVDGDKKLKVIYRELPILSEESKEAARVSLLAAEQGKYMPFHKALYAAGHPTRDSILAAAAKSGIDAKEAAAAMASERRDVEIENNLKLAQALGANGTPTFVIGDQVLAGAVGYDALKEAVATARQK